ncbi:MAG: transcription-repair coupling factor [Candidatus Magnetoovum sp. WYHC-5]|nr:transcription-repair coupling factor [Candidatus Magnetoovum sp. WYHC-5]
MVFSELIKLWFNSISTGVDKGDKVFNLRGSLLALFLVLFRKNFLLICKDSDECQKIKEDYDFFKQIVPTGELVFFPDADDIVAKAQQVEITVHAKKYNSLLCTLDTALTSIKTPTELSSESITLTRAEEVSREDVVEFLTEFGYKSVSMVLEKGEFSIRNYVLDLFLPNMENPVRVEFFGDEIDSIRFFAPDTQRTIKHIDKIELFPIKQTGGRRYIHEIFNLSHVLYMDNVGDDSIDRLRKLCTETVSFTLLSQDPIVDTEGVDAGYLSLNGYGILLNERTSLSLLVEGVRRLYAQNRVMIVSATTAQAERVKDIFMEADMLVPILKLDEVGTWTGGIFITTGALMEGFFVQNLVVLTEKELFGEIKVRRKQSPKTTTITDYLSQMEDLKPSDYVVHEDHGIGIFEQLRHEVVEGFESDMLLINYDDGARLYLPVYSLGKIKKYRAQEGVLPKLDRLGGKTWQKVKAKVRKKLKIAAEKLVRHYAERELSRAYSFSADNHVHKEFDNFFPYDETPDQLTAIEQIKMDMESEKPMDRLLCGDVGYGKTEVAMRAAFKAFYDSKQVVVLVPTTILCEQHYMTFKERFNAFPVKIDYVSRFKPRPHINETLKRLARGEVDIIIGTHALLRKDVEVPALGLLIIDEEHRFGVSQKEKIKELKKDIHFLSLSATPIPRTLQMSLSGIWNLSTIETPPVDRQAVRTIISKFDTNLLKEAIHRELTRGGQVYFVHNRIRDIEKIAFKVKENAPPSTKVEIAHGQMKESELEDIIINFIKGDIDILVSTAIVGSGMDIPRANTIIVDRAELMGLADLHQLRGRVGRGNVRGYAYFFIPGEDFITETARKRLTAISDFSYLGAGFHLAMKDMEIRGAGNLLGAEQSGHIHEVGLDTYMEMLELEVAETRGKPIETEPEPQIDLKIEAFIPDTFIEDVSLRLNFYRRIVVAKEEEDLFSLKDELSDRFGRLPEPLETFFDAMRLKLLCKKLKIAAITQSRTKVVVNFLNERYLQIDNLLTIKRHMGMDFKHINDSLEFLLTEFKESVLSVLIEIFKRLVYIIEEERETTLAFAG